MKSLSMVLKSSRPVSWINTAYPFAAAYLMITRQIDLTLVLGTLFFLIPYNLLMYGINDVFDYESDLRNARKGGIEGAILPKELHKTVILSGVISAAPFVVALLALGNLLSSTVLIFSLFTVVAYSVKGLRFKERPFLDSVTSATHFVLPMVFAFAVTGSNLQSKTFVTITVAFMLWAMASHAFGAVQDVKADREGNISSIATYFGSRATTRSAFVMYLASGIYLFTLGWPNNLVAAVNVGYLAILFPHLWITDETCEKANIGWRKFIWLNFLAGFIVTMVLIYNLLKP